MKLKFKKRTNKTTQTIKTIRIKRLFRKDLIKAIIGSEIHAPDWCGTIRVATDFSMEGGDISYVCSSAKYEVNLKYDIIKQLMDKKGYINNNNYSTMGTTFVMGVFATKMI